MERLNHELANLILIVGICLYRMILGLFRVLRLQSLGLDLRTKTFKLLILKVDKGLLDNGWARRLPKLIKAIDEVAHDN